MAFGFNTFAETPFSSLPSNIYFSISGQQVNTTLGNIVIDADANITGSFTLRSYETVFVRKLPAENIFGSGTIRMVPVSF